MRTRERREDDGLMIAFRHRHSYSVVMALLILAEKLEVARIEEVGVRIESAEHSRNRALVDGFIGSYGVGEVLLHHVVDFGENFQPGSHIYFIAGRPHLHP